MIERLRALAGPLLGALEKSGMALVVTGPSAEDRPIVLVNEAFSRLTGYPAAECLGRNGRFLHAPDADRATIGRIHDALTAGREIDADLLCRRKDGTTFWNRLHVSPLRDAGKVVFHLTTSIDVTGEHVAATLRAQITDARQELTGLQDRLRIARTVTGMTGAWEWDIPSGRLYGDARFADLYGLDPAAAADGLPTSAFTAAIHPSDRPRVQLAIAGILGGAEVFAKDYRIIGADGTVAWVSARGHVHLNDQDEPVRFTGVLSDISRQRRIEERLRVAQGAGGVGTFEYHAGFGTAEVSGQFCRLLGLRETGILPVKTINSVVHPDDPPIVESTLDPSAGPSFGAFRILRADTGELRWMARRGEITWDDSGADARFVGVIYDVTAAKEAETKLRELADTLEQRVRDRTRERDRVWILSRDLVSASGFDGVLRAVNPAWQAVVGYSEAELVGTRLDALIHQEDRAAAAAYFDELIQKKDVRDFDCRLRHKNGTYRWINWTAIPEDDVFYSIGRDVTQRKHLEDLLRQSQKMEAVGQLTGGLAHDFNNMLMGIMGGLDVMRRRVADGKLADLDRLIGMALAAADRAAALTHRLLAFSRRQSLDSRALDVNALVLSMEDLLRRTLGERFAVALDLAPDAWTAMADSNQLESAILNLAINARDAMPHGGRLTIGTTNVALAAGPAQDHPELAPGHYLRIAVTDTGVGMPPQIANRAFEPFYTTKPIGQGTGLGLSMVYGFAQQSKGRATIESKVGTGTTVAILLPRFEARAEPGTEAHAIEVSRGNGETVLLVEDDETVRSLVLEVLGEIGYLAIEARNGDEALAILRSSRHLDLMVSDVGLPGLNGRQIAAIAREHRPDLRILFMTGYAADAMDRPNFLGAGMDLILKPFSMDTISARIRHMIAG